MVANHNSLHLTDPPEPHPPRPRRRRALQASIGILLLLLVIGVAWYLQSPAFNRFVSGKIAASLDEATGGKAHVGELRWNVSKLEVELRNLTIRGTEAPDQAPFAHIDRLLLRLKIISLVRGDMGLRTIEAERPVFHFITYRDGSTNMPRSKQKSTTKPVDQLFQMAIERAVISDGLILWNDNPAPLDLTADNITAQVGYNLAEQRYDGKLNFGKLDAKFKDMRPFAADAEINFRLFPTHFDLGSFRLTSERSNIEASGQLVNFDDPHVTLIYNARVDLHQAGVILRNPQLRAGELTFNGKGTFTQAALDSNGRVAIQHVAIDTGAYRIPDVNAGADFELTRTRFDLSKLLGHALGGVVTGTMKVENWASSPEPGARGTSPPQRGTARFNLSGISLARAADMVSSPSMPLNKVNPVGTVGGAVTAQWTGSAADVVAALTLQVVPPQKVAPNQLPVNARLLASYDAGRELLSVQQFDAATRATRLNASGTVGTRTGQLKVALTSSDLDEFRPAIAAFGGPNRLPVELGGTVSFNGTVAGALRAPTFAGHLDVTNFNSVFRVAAKTAPAMPLRAVSTRPAAAPTTASPTTQEVRMHWDQLATDLTLAPNQTSVRNLVLQRGSTRIAANGQAALRDFKFTESSPFNARVTMSNADVAELQQMAGYSLPLTGRANLDITASGTQSDPRATGRAQLTGVTYQQEQVSSLSADLNLANQVAAVNNLALVHAAGRLTGSAAYNLKTKAMRFDLRGADIDMAKLQMLRTARTSSVAGRLTFSAQGAGTPDAPSLNANVRVSDLVINGEQVGTVALDATTQGADMHLTGSTRLANAVLLLNGTIRLRDDYPANLHLHFANVDFDPVLRAYLQGRLTGHSSIAGDIRIEGPARRPRDLNIAGDIPQVSLEIENVKLRNDGPIQFSLAQQQLRLQHLHIVGDNTDITASGSADLGAKQMDMRADGRINLQLVQTINPAYQSSGMVTLALHGTGAFAQPRMDGQITIADGAISYIDLPNGLANVNGTLVFNQNQLQVKQLTAHSGGGEFQVGGYITYANGVNLNLTATARDIRLRYPPGVSAGADADLRLTGGFTNALLAGDVTVTKFALNQRFDFSLYLARAKQPPTAPDPTSPLNNLHLDVHIVSTPALQVQTSLAKLSGDVDLRLRGTGTRPAVLGRVNIVEGDIYFNSTKYHLERGDVMFSNPIRIEPILNVEASARVRDYDITIGLHGHIDNLTTTYRSEPPLASADIIALLAFGRTREEAALNPQPTPNFTETASNAILGQALNSVVSSRVQKLFGVSRIKIDPQVGTATSNPSARITIEQQVSNKVTLTYITDVTQSQQQVIQFEYNVNRNVSIIGVRDQYGVVGLDIRVRQRKK